jgi:hypothetical protein
MSNEIISAADLAQSLLFARLSAAAYLNKTVLNETGLKKLMNENRFSVESTDTQGVMGVWNNDLVIAFRGTEANASDCLATNAKVGFVNNPRGVGQMHSGFVKAAKSVYPLVKTFIRNHKDPDSRIYLCGHSLGGAIATIITGWLKNDQSTLDPRAFLLLEHLVSVTKLMLSGGERVDSPNALMPGLPPEIPFHE